MDFVVVNAREADKSLINKVANEAGLVPEQVSGVYCFYTDKGSRVGQVVRQRTQHNGNTYYRLYPTGFRSERRAFEATEAARTDVTRRMHKSVL